MRIVRDTRKNLIFEIANDHYNMEKEKIINYLIKKGYKKRTYEANAHIPFHYNTMLSQIGTNDPERLQTYAINKIYEKSFLTERKSDISLDLKIVSEENLSREEINDYINNQGVKGQLDHTWTIILQDFYEGKASKEKAIEKMKKITESRLKSERTRLIKGFDNMYKKG